MDLDGISLCIARRWLVHGHDCIDGGWQLYWIDNCVAEPKMSAFLMALMVLWDYLRPVQCGYSDQYFS
jgi:hypothetical protein